MCYDDDRGGGGDSISCVMMMIEVAVEIASHVL